MLLYISHIIYTSKDIRESNLSQNTKASFEAPVNYKFSLVVIYSKHFNLSFSSCLI